ncbi:MAG TPA: ComF family protein [Candidatus Limnocylindrales bacterium]|nr:ComF family protein [Candidatus Limnocylindrales bacterium]
MRRLLDVLMPPQCPGCGLEGQLLCTACLRSMGRRMNEPPGVPIGLQSAQPAGIVQIEWCGPYAGPARSSLHALKYDGEQRLAGPLGQLMAARWRRAGVGGEVLVPVPVHAARQRERGFDQAELLAREVGRQLGLPVVSALRRTERTAAQHGLSRSARQANVGRVFDVREQYLTQIAGRWIVLIDDVSTTGSTLVGCAAALYGAGVAAVSALALARER